MIYHIPLETEWELCDSLKIVMFPDDDLLYSNESFPLLDMGQSILEKTLSKITNIFYVSVIYLAYNSNVQYVINCCYTNDNKLLKAFNS